jgi:hypothetical protein
MEVRNDYGAYSTLQIGFKARSSSCYHRGLEECDSNDDRKGCASTARNDFLFEIYEDAYECATAEIESEICALVTRLVCCPRLWKMKMGILKTQNPLSLSGFVSCNLFSKARGLFTAEYLLM